MRKLKMDGMGWKNAERDDRFEASPIGLYQVTRIVMPDLQDCQEPSYISSTYPLCRAGTAIAQQ
jgi:hypothetical protein